MKTIKKPEEKQTPYTLKLWGLQLPLAKPLTAKDAKWMFVAFLILILVLAAFSSKSAWIAAGSGMADKGIGWVKGLISQKTSRSP